MANSEHLEIVRAGAAAVRVWRENNPGVNLDLQGADLRGLDLSQVSLRGSNLMGAKGEKKKKEKERGRRV